MADSRVRKIRGMEKTKMIYIKRHSATAEVVTYDIRIYSSIEKFHELVNVTKEEILKMVTMYKLRPTPLSIRIYNRLMGQGDEEEL